MPAEPPKMITLRDVARILNVGYSTAEKMKAAGQLPPCVRYSSRSHRWKESDVLAWIERMAKQRR